MAKFLSTISRASPWWHYLPGRHFRCVPEIIQFSNLISYDTASTFARCQPRSAPSSHHRLSCSGSSRDGKINRQEALATASLLVAAIEQPNTEE